MNFLQPESDFYDPDDVGSKSPQLEPTSVRLMPSRSPSPFGYEPLILEDLAFDDSCEGLMSDLYPRLPRVTLDYPSPSDSDPYRWCFQMDLPLTVRGSTVLARPDSGCEENIMSASLAAELGLPVSRKMEHKKPFRVANGRTVEALGRVSIWSCFPEEPWKEMRLDIYLLPKTVTPLIVGMKFLAETKVLNERRHRMQPRNLKRRGPYQVSLLNSPKQRIHCIAESKPVSGNPDTGSEIDLMSLSYAKDRGFPLEDILDEEDMVVFADGSSCKLRGKVTVSITVCSEDPLRGEMIFYVLEGLTCDILFGEEFLYGNKIFQNHQSAFGTDAADQYSEANGIFWQRRGESYLSRLFTSREHRAVPLHEPNVVSYVSQELEELHRREVNLDAIEELTGEAKERALLLEVERRAEYDGTIQQYSPLNQRLAQSSDHMENDEILPPMVTGESAAETYNNSSDTSTSASQTRYPVGGGDSRPSSPGHGSHPSPPKFLPSPGRNSFSSPRRLPQNEVSTLYSDGLPYPSPVDYNSSDAVTPSDQSTPAISIDRMSIDEISDPQVGGYRCTHAGCTAAPFQTQYLLNSHANVHSQPRPHYCAVEGCPRSVGGKGFKRKNEMIRHGLVHDSPGYVCPFCPDREHKYPRPENLQRHVRVHHVDVDRDDPKLRDVLAQRPEGPSRGRRRRG